MRGLFRTRQRKLTAVSVVGLVSLLAGLIVGINAASGTNVAGLGPLDHYLCYSAAPVPATAGTLQFPKKPTAAWLQNQFGSVLGAVTGLQRHCNPVQKTTPDGAVTPINKANDHLACWGFRSNPNSVPPLVKITNQFSPTDAANNPVPVPLQVGPLQSLCLPSFKSLTAANLQSGAPDDLDHFSCYQVTYPKGTNVKFAPPNPVQLDDQFSRLLVPAQSLRATVVAPQSLCLPTIKIINPNPFVAPPTFNDLLDKTDHLVCFAVRITSPSPFVSPAASVFDSNQFGVGHITIKSAQQLCVPSLKEVPPPTSTTTTSIAGVTTTTCTPATGSCATTTTTPCPSGPNCTTSPPLINKKFGETQIALGASTSLAFTIQDPNSAANLTAVSFNDNLPPGLHVAAPLNGLAGGCPGAVINAPPGAPVVTMTGATLPPLASCSFKVDVTGMAPGTWTNVTEPVTSAESGPGNTATATVVVG